MRAEILSVTTFLRRAVSQVVQTIMQCYITIRPLFDRTVPTESCVWSESRSRDLVRQAEGRPGDTSQQVSRLRRAPFRTPTSGSRALDRPTPRDTFVTICRRNTTPQREPRPTSALKQYKLSKIRAIKPNSIYHRFNMEPVPNK